MLVVTGYSTRWQHARIAKNGAQWQKGVIHVADRVTGEVGSIDGWVGRFATPTDRGVTYAATKVNLLHEVGPYIGVKVVTKGNGSRLQLKGNSCPDGDDYRLWDVGGVLDRAHKEGIHLHLTHPTPAEGEP